IGARISARAAAASVVSEDGEALGEQRCERGAGTRAAMTEGAINQDQRRPLPAPLEGDRRPVNGADRFDGSCSPDGVLRGVLLNRGRRKLAHRVLLPNRTRRYSTI